MGNSQHSLERVTPNLCFKRKPKLFRTYRWDRKPNFCICFFSVLLLADILSVCFAVIWFCIFFILLFFPSVFVCLLSKNFALLYTVQNFTSFSLACQSISIQKLVVIDFCSKEDRSGAHFGVTKMLISRFLDKKKSYFLHPVILISGPDVSVS